MLNLWDPGHLSLVLGLVTSLLLGMVHGITPDEHTWPITFSYSIGSYSSRGGLRAGLVFSSGFTLQRALASELAYLALAGFLMHAVAENVIYVLVGMLMAASGYYVLFRGAHGHRHPWIDRLLPKIDDTQSVPVRLAFWHGIVAGWGTGAFATILYTVISPTMPSVWVGFLPGLFFGLGTLVMQVVIGATFGWWMGKRKLTASHKAWVGQKVAGNTLLYGGVLFVLAGIVGLAVPSVSAWALPTGLHIHNLDSINLGLVLVILVVAGVGGVSMWRALRDVKKTEGANSV